MFLKLLYFRFLGVVFIEWFLVRLIGIMVLGMMFVKNSLVKFFIMLCIVNLFLYINF